MRSGKAEMKFLLSAMGFFFSHLTSLASFFISDWKLLGLSSPHLSY